MRVQILRGFCLGDGVDVSPGDVVDIAGHRVALLTAQGKVKTLPAAVADTAAPAADETRKPLLKGRKNA